MPATLSTTVRHIYDRVPNSVNSQLIAEFHQYMKDNGTSERHQNNNLKAMIAFAEYLGADTTFHQVKSKNHIISFLDTIELANRQPEIAVEGNDVRLTPQGIEYCKANIPGVLDDF